MINKKILLSLLVSSTILSANYADYKQMINSNPLKLNEVDQRMQTFASNYQINNLEEIKNFQNLNTSTQKDWTYNCVNYSGCTFTQTGSYGSDINSINQSIKNIENSVNNNDISKMNQQQEDYTKREVSLYQNGQKSFLNNNSLMTGIDEETDVINDIHEMDKLLTEEGLYHQNFKVLTEDRDIIVYEQMGDSIEVEGQNIYTTDQNIATLNAKKDELSNYKQSLEDLKARAQAKVNSYNSMPSTLTYTDQSCSTNAEKVVVCSNYTVSVANAAKSNGLRDANAYLNKINQSITNLNKDIQRLEDNIQIQEKNKQKEAYMKRMVDFAQQFELSLYLRLSYEDYVMRNDFLYEKGLAYQIYTGQCKNYDFSSESKIPSKRPEDIEEGESDTYDDMSYDMIRNYQELCILHKSAEDLSFVMNDFKIAMQIAMQNYLLGNYDESVLASYFNPPTDEIGLDSPLAYNSVIEMYLENNEFVSKFSEKIVVDMYVITENYPLKYREKNRDFYEELEVDQEWDNKVRLDDFIESINSIEVIGKSCDSNGGNCEDYITSNIENMFVSNNYYLTSTELTDAEHKSNIVFFGNLLKMNRLVKEAEAVLEVSPASAYNEINKVQEMFDKTFPVSENYITLADYKMRDKLKNGKDSDNGGGSKDDDKSSSTTPGGTSGGGTNEGGTNGGKDETSPTTPGGTSSGETNESTEENTNQENGMGETGGGSRLNPYEDNFPTYIPINTDYSSEWEGGLLILEDYILSLYLKDLEASGYKDMNIKTQNVGADGKINMLYDNNEKGRSNILHNDNRTLNNKFKLEYSRDSDFRNGTTIIDKKYQGVTAPGVLENNYNAAIKPSVNNNTFQNAKKTAKDITPTAIKLNSGAKCINLGGDCVPTIKYRPSYTQSNNWGGESLNNGNTNNEED